MLLVVRLNLIRLSIFALFLGGCSNDWQATGGTSDDSGQGSWGHESASGQINGQPWDFKGGSGHLVRKGSQEYLIIRLWSERPGDPCNERQGSPLQVRISTPNQRNHWTITPQDPFNATHAVFFSDRDFRPSPLDNLKSDEGEIVLDEITKVAVSGRFRSSFKHARVGKTEVQGAFSVPLCGSQRRFEYDKFSP